MSVRADYRVECGRCGIKTSAQYCQDCRAVDPDFCRGGLTSREIYALRKQETLKRIAERAMLERMLGTNMTLHAETTARHNARRTAKNRAAARAKREAAVR